MSLVGDIVRILAWWFFIEIAGMVGRVAVRIVTLNRVKWHPDDPMEELLSAIVGVAVFIGIGLLVAFWLGSDG